MGGPACDLKEVRALIRSGCFLIFQRNLECVCDSLGLSVDRARTLILNQIEMLSPRNYNSTLPPERAGHTPADVYGVYAERKGWYIKITVRNAKLVVVSFHPPEHPLSTPDGWIRGAL